MEQCFRIVYCSKSISYDSPERADAAIRLILTRSRANNDRHGITGALLFGGTCFAQVLEGPAIPVLATMDRIRRDPLHREVTVLQQRAVAWRSFPRWSMAYAGLRPADGALAGLLLSMALDALPSDDLPADAARLHGLLRHLAVAGERWIDPDDAGRHGFPNPVAAD